MAVKLHRCSWTWLKVAHPCWTVQRELDEAGIEYKVVKVPARRGQRAEVIAHTNQKMVPVIEFEDGRWLREESKDLAARIREGRLFEKAPAAPPPAGSSDQPASA